MSFDLPTQKPLLTSAVSNYGPLQQDSISNFCCRLARRGLRARKRSDADEDLPLTYLYAFYLARAPFSLALLPRMLHFFERVTMAAYLTASKWLYFPVT